MTNIRIILLLLFLVPSIGRGQSVSDDFKQRLSEIKRQLELLSDSLSPGLNEPVDFSTSTMPVQSFLRSIAASHKLNIQIDPTLDLLVTNNFTSVQVKDLLYFVCSEYQLDIRFVGTIMSFSKYQPPLRLPQQIAPRKINIGYDGTTGLISFDLQGDSLRAVVKEITRVTGQNVITAGGGDLDNRRVRGYIKDLPLENALDKLALMNGLIFSKTKDGVYMLEGEMITPNQPQISNRNNQGNLTSSRQSVQGDIIVSDSVISMDVVNYPILDIIKTASEKIGINYIMFTEVTGNTTAKVTRVTYAELLSFLFQGTNFTHLRKNGVYLIGQRTQEGFRGTELVKLDYRTIEGVDKEIPADLSKDLEIKVLKELNAFIITGNKQRIDELTTFIRLIDKPIPNILIEVIVADARKGFNLQTGLQAFLSDSVPKTGGQIFPGVDLTLSSKSVNNLLDKLDGKGLVNLGRVTPGFYATLKALEESNNIQVRSTPKLSTMNGNKANLIIGESVYYLEQTQNITGGVTPITTTSQRFNKVEANLSITISPVVSGNEHITLDIVAEFSDFISPTVANAPPGNTTRKFESKIRVRNEEMIILGGLEETSKSETGSGVPLLSRIPILKWFFSSKSKQSSTNRLIVFIKPTLVY